MTTEIISYLSGSFFGVFLCFQYFIFYIFLSKKNEIKKSKEDLIYIILIGFFTVFTSLFGLQALLVTDRNLLVLFNKIKLICGIFIFVLYIMLLRYLLVSIKDMTFVETDEYKSNSKNYLIYFTSFSLILAIFVGIFGFSYDERSLRHILFLAMFLTFAIAGAIIETIAFSDL